MVFIGSFILKGIWKMPHAHKMIKHGHPVSYVGSKLGKFAKYAAKHAAGAIGNHIRKRLYESISTKEEEKPNIGLETGYAPAHSAIDHVKRITKAGKRKYKKMVKFERKVERAIAGHSKFQQVFYNSMLGPTLAADSQNWFEIPIMCGALYIQPGTTTDANNANFIQRIDGGDGYALSDVAVNFSTALLVQQGLTPGASGPANTATTVNTHAFVHGYMLEYNLINPTTSSMRVDVYECVCIKRMDNSPVAGVAANVDNFVGSTGLLVEGQTAAGSEGQNLKVGGTKTNLTNNITDIGTNPFTNAFFGRYFRVEKHHSHVLDSLQTLTLEKRCKFHKPINAVDFSVGTFFPGLSRCILISYRGNVPSGSSGYYCNAPSPVAIGNGGFTHTLGVTYLKKFVVVPSQESVNTLGTARVNA